MAFPNKRNPSLEPAKRMKDYVEQAWQKNLFCQRLSLEGHIWNWTKDGVITRDGTVMHMGRFDYDPVEFIQLIAIAGERAGDVAALLSFLAKRESRKGSHKARDSNVRALFQAGQVHLIVSGEHVSKIVRVQSVDLTGYSPLYNVRDTDPPYEHFTVEEFCFDQS